MAAYAHDSTFVPRRIVVFLFIVAFHIALVWALATGLARKVVEVLAPPIQTDIIEEMQQDEPPPPPPPPQMERPPVEVPPPEVNIQIPVDTTTSTAITDVTDRPAPMAPPPPPRAVVRHNPTLDKRSQPTEDYYPPASKRAEEEGTTTVRVCINEQGRLAGTPTVTKSSGFERLDEAAIKWTTRGARFKPGTEDGKAVEQCFQFNVRFKLTN
ncbi:MAG TPA: energy transducer TonB [Steroidobacteraceae bacterium]|nr:energy transducer TonB [Steroidobacteraceae bacterium]HQX46572.1 energy transducer TonB [Steroidobacteraceae bacterium]HQX77536.1 energy transducer TonB [Steroidobacteraceae bacterium]HQZ80057.1 energy transducer TonB [Steroidobacteraceae bacterium]